MVSTLAMADALAKLLIEKGIITDAEFKQKLLEERAVYQRILIRHTVIVLGTRRRAHVWTQVAFRGELMAKY